jgi:hypothetical protein
VKIGDTVYRFDGNWRVYRKDANGRGVGPPLYREHWRPTAIVGETSRSWVTTFGTKLPKGKPAPRGWCYSLADIEREAFRDEHAYRIAEAIHRLDYDTLAAVARLIGYSPEPPP